MKKTAIKVKDKKQFEVIIGILLSSGRNFSDLRKHHTPKTYADAVYRAYPYPFIDEEINATCNPRDYNVLNWPEQAEKILEVIFKKSYKVDNLCDYGAEVTEDGIKVGCQTISFEKFTDLSKVVSEFRKDKGI